MDERDTTLARVIRTPRQRLREALDQMVAAFGDQGHCSDNDPACPTHAPLRIALDAARAAIKCDDDAWAWADQNPVAVITAMYPPPETAEEFNDD
jgi:hypothetical protein